MRGDEGEEGPVCGGMKGRRGLCAGGWRGGGACVRGDEGEEGPVCGGMRGRRGLCAGG